MWIEALGCGDPSGCSAAGAVVAQRAVVRFARGQTEEVPLLLASACIGVACADDQRCAADIGRCEAATRAQAMVRSFGGTDAATAAMDASVRADVGGLDGVPVTDAPSKDGGTSMDRSTPGPDATASEDHSIVDALGRDAGCVVVACPPSYGWAQRFGLRRTDSSVRAVAVDSAGNVYLAGQGASGTTFGGAPITATNSAAFVSSFAPDGRPRWFRQIGTDGATTSLSVDAAGNLYLTGHCYAPVDFGNGPLAGMAADTSGMFLASLTTDGVHRWSRRFPGTSLADITVAGGALVGVGVNGSNPGDGAVDFGGGSSTGAAGELFVASFSLDGTHRWSRHFGSNNGDPRVAASASGVVCIAGSQRTPLDFGGGPLTGDGTTQPYLACLTAAGEHRWSRRFESDGTMAYATDVAVDASGNATMTGLFERAIDFGGGSRRSVGGYDVFVASFTPEGAHRWSQQLGGAMIDGSTAVATDDVGNTFVTGYFQASQSFGGALIASAGLRDVFLAAFSPAGEPRWFRHYGSAEEDYGFAVAVTASRVALTGVFIGDVDFGGGVLSAVGTRDVFVLSLVRE